VKVSELKKIVLQIGLQGICTGVLPMENCVMDWAVTL